MQHYFRTLAVTLSANILLITIILSNSYGYQSKTRVMKKTGYLRNEKIITKFGKRLKKLRLEKGLSQEDLAYEAEITVTYISKMEHGKVNTSLSHMHALSKALDIKIIELLNFTED